MRYGFFHHFQFLGGEFNYNHLTMNQIGYESRQSVVLTLGPSILDCDILALNVAGFGQAAVERGDRVT